MGPPRCKGRQVVQGEDLFRVRFLNRSRCPNSSTFAALSPLRVEQRLGSCVSQLLPCAASAAGAHRFGANFKDTPWSTNNRAPISVAHVKLAVPSAR